MGKDTKERNAYMTKWKKENRERLDVLFEKGTKDRIKAAADELGESAGEFVRKAVEMRLATLEQHKNDEAMF